MTDFVKFAEAEGMTVTDLADIEDSVALDAIADFYAMTLNKLANGHKGGKPMLLDLYLVHERGLNAFAASFNDADVIGVNSGVFQLLLATARGLVSQGLISPAISTVGHAPEPITSPVDPVSSQDDPSSLYVGPLSDPLREELALRVYRMAALFLLSHEFQHIYNGHTDWVENATGLKLVRELR